MNDRAEKINKINEKMDKIRKKWKRKEITNEFYKNEIIRLLRKAHDLCVESNREMTTDIMRLEVINYGSILSENNRKELMSENLSFSDDKEIENFINRINKEIEDNESVFKNEFKIERQ